MVKCPKCGSTKISGLMAAFWVELGEDGSPKGKWRDFESATELGTERECSDCGHQFDVGDIEEDLE